MLFSHLIFEAVPEKSQHAKDVAYFLIDNASWIYTVLIIIAFVAPLLILFLKKHGTKDMMPEKFGENGQYILGDPNLRKNFESIRKEGDNLVFVAGEYTKSAYITIVNFSYRKRINSFKLDFSNGRTIKVPLPANSESITIVPESINDVKMVGPYDLNPSKLTCFLCAFIPSVLFTICLYYETFTMAFGFRDDQLSRHSIYFFVSALPLLVGLPGIYFALRYFSKRVRK